MSTPMFEDVTDKFLGMTKTQFTMIAAAGSMVAATLAAVSLGLWAHTAAQRRADFCRAVNTVNGSIRTILNTSIAQAEKDLKDPKFAKFKAELRLAIKQDMSWERKLFANRPC